MHAAPLVVHRRYFIMVPRPLPRCALQVLERGAQAAARGATQVLDRGAQAVARCAAALSQQETNNPEDIQRGRAKITGFICAVVR